MPRARADARVPCMPERGKPANRARMRARVLPRVLEEVSPRRRRAPPLPPLMCLGAGTTCPARIPLALAKQLLAVDEFNALVSAAFASHIAKNADAFRFCPTAGCSLGVPRGTARERRTWEGARQGRHCSAALHASFETCAACDAPAHEGLTCDEAGDGGEMFADWAAAAGVKQCPSCRMGIEKEAGVQPHGVHDVPDPYLLGVQQNVPERETGYTSTMHAVHGDYGLEPAE